MEHEFHSTAICKSLGTGGSPTQPTVSSGTDLHDVVAGAIARLAVEGWRHWGIGLHPNRYSTRIALQLGRACRTIVNITNFLLILIILILEQQFHPEFANQVFVFAGVAGAIYGVYWLIARFPAVWRQNRQRRAQEIADHKEYWEYEAERRQIRAKYDPGNQWNEATSVPREYLDEIRRLNQNHRWMLMRRNDWKAEDFE